MSRPQLLPQIGTGLGSRKKGSVELGFREDVPKAKKGVSQAVAKPKKPLAPKGAPMGSSPDIKKVLKVRRGVLNAIQQGKASESDIMATLDASGIKDPLAVETILSAKLNDNVIKYFLNATKNNPKKAKSLAKKFGFEV